MDEQEVLEVLLRIGAIKTFDHFVYAAGDHGDTYVNKDVVYAHPMIVSHLCRAIAERLTSEWIDVVIAPAVGGVLLAQGIAHHLCTMMGRDVKAAFAEKKEDGGFMIRGAYLPFIRGEEIHGRKTNKILVVEDIVTTGSSACQVVDLTRSHGGDVVGLAAICNRGKVTVDDVGYPGMFFSLLDLRLEKWSAAKCPLCANNVPVNTEIGHGKKFLTKQNAA